MIDWWPWWVTTAVALPVAVVALAVALLVGRREARAGLVLVGLTAVGLGIAAPFVMGQSHSSGPTMTPAGSKRLSAREFAKRADANCRHLAKQPASNFGTPAPTPGFARKLDTFLPLLKEALRAQGELRPPPEERETATRWMNAMTAVGQDFEAMRDAAKRSDEAAFGAAGSRLSAHAGQSARLSKRLGQTYCFQG